MKNGRAYARLSRPHLQKESPQIPQLQLRYSLGVPVLHILDRQERRKVQEALFTVLCAV